MIITENIKQELYASKSIIKYEVQMVGILTLKPILDFNEVF